MAEIQYWDTTQSGASEYDGGTTATLYLTEPRSLVKKDGDTLIVDKPHTVSTFLHSDGRPRTSRTGE